MTRQFTLSSPVAFLPLSARVQFTFGTPACALTSPSSKYTSITLTTKNENAENVIFSEIILFSRVFAFKFYCTTEAEAIAVSHCL
eukprot:UN24244